MDASVVKQLRYRLRLVAAIWLVCQIGAIVAAPIMLRCTPATAAAGADEDCCPGLAPGQVCPMHHTKAGARHCAMRSACGSSDAALLTLAGLIAPPSSAASGPSMLLANEPVSPIAVAPLARSLRPESPPPRA